jgi:hypothetical protein
MVDLIREAANPDTIQVAVQLAKIGDKIWLGLLGGELLSRKDMQWMAEPKNAGAAAPEYCSYLLAQGQLSSAREMKFSYDVVWGESCRVNGSFCRLGAKIGAIFILCGDAPLDDAKV